MKKVICAILAVCIIIGCMPFAVASGGGDVTVTASTPVVISENATEQEQFAAERLCYYLGLVFGTEPAVTTEKSSSCIAVGSASGKDTSSLEENGYEITAENGCVQIAGTGTRGTIQGAYRFLEEFAGVHNYTSTLITTAHTDAITVPSDTDIVYAPFFEYTDTDWSSPKDTEYSIANGLDGGTYRQISTAQGGSVRYVGSWCHTLTNNFCSSAEYFESHPEYFALHDGERYSGQLCLSNPDVLEIVKAEVLELLKEQYVDDGTVQIVSVTQNDNQKYCECDDCVAYENAHGGVHSATMLRFVNEIADAVKQAGYENIAVDTFAYQYTRHAPTGIVPRDNVIVRMCTAELCAKHTIDDPACPDNVPVMEDLEAWSEICNRLYIWDYVTDFPNTLCVYPDFNTIQRNIQIFYEHNVKGIYEEGNYYMYRCDTEFGELRAYMISKFLQNPYADYDEVVNGFLDAYYGTAAAGTIREILDFYVLHAGKKDNGDLGIYSACKNCLNMSDSDVYKTDCMWEEAENADVTQTQKANILRSELSWRWYKVQTRRGEFSLLNAKRFEEKEQLFDDLIAAGVTTTGEGLNSTLNDGAYVRYAKPSQWSDATVTDDEKNALTVFGSILEAGTYFLTCFNLLYKIYGSFMKTFSGC